MKITLEPGEKLEVSGTDNPNQSYVVSYVGGKLIILAKNEPLRLDTFPRAEEVLARAARIAGAGPRMEFGATLDPSILEGSGWDKARLSA